MAKTKSSLNSQETNPQKKLEPYLVLARKYRPQNFNDLIGQDTMVRTLKNAFSLGRIAQAYMLTGVRGVGKTTTARILARALNYETESLNKPSVDLDSFGKHCAEIMESRHPDVIEMDAASNTGIDNIREVIESAKYKPILARTKVFIIDEVHMLSKGAFNALLKTLEEPPEHVKFIFATTEIRKVPVTVLSRCQRFDLRRVDVVKLANHLGNIAQKENAKADSDALTIIAKAAGGSVRDALSILDQAITMGSGAVTSNLVEEMLGLADKGRIFDLLGAVISGKTAESLQLFSSLYNDGAEPSQLLAELLEVVHLISRCKVINNQAFDNHDGLSEEERRKAREFSERLSTPLLSRLWQMLFKGLEEVHKASNSKTAAEMILIRLSYAADLPPPNEIIKALGQGGSLSISQGKSKSDSMPNTLKGAAPDLTPQPKKPELTLGLSTETLPVEQFNINADQFSPDEFSRNEIEDLGIEEDVIQQKSERDIFPILNTFADVINLAGERRDARLRVHLEEHISLVKFDPVAGSIDIFLLEGAPPEIANELREKLNRWTGRRWVIVLSKTKGDLPIAVRRREQERVEIEKLKKHPAVAMLLKVFPNATITRFTEDTPIKSGETGTG